MFYLRFSTHNGDQSRHQTKYEDVVQDGLTELDSKSVEDTDPKFEVCDDVMYHADYRLK